MTSLQAAIRFSPKKLVNTDKPLVACVSGKNFWVYYPQAPGSPRNNILNMKGTLEDLYELIPRDTPVFDVNKVSVKIFFSYRPREYDREGTASIDEFIQALRENGGKEI